jgi:membrane-bound lytic murein transglycosylase D
MGAGSVPRGFKREIIILRRCLMRRVLIVLGLILILAAAIVPVVHAKPDECGVIYHTVRHGDTLFRLSRHYGVSPWTIASYNGLTNPNCIYPGQVLAIPDCHRCPGCQPGWGWKPAPCCGSCATYHTVARGENLYRISLRYGVNMWQIAKCNGIYNLHHIRAGDVLCISY